MWQVGRLLALCLAAPVSADTVVAARSLRAQHVLTPADLAMVPQVVPGAVQDPHVLLGRETRVAIYANRPVFLADTAEPALVERNQVITLVYDSGVLRIETEGRALGRGAAGDVIEVMNLASRTRVTAQVMPNGTVVVSP